jgi:3-hydroxyanthranilate 3,4-dioxygenase
MSSTPNSEYRTPAPVHLSVPNWIAENEKFFLPPVCNKMMHDFQLKVGTTCCLRN